MMKLIVFIRLPVTRALAPATAPERAPNATLWPLMFQLPLPLLLTHSLSGCVRCAPEALPSAVAMLPK